MVKEISNSLSNSSYWMSTQTIAYSLKAIGMFVATEKRGELKFSYSYGGKSINASTNLPAFTSSTCHRGGTKSADKNFE